MTAAIEAPAAPVLGLHTDLTNEAYHADKTSLSSTGARKLLPPSCPAKFKWERDNGQPPKRTFDIGNAAHKLVLGEGVDVKVLDFDNYLTKAAQQAKRDAYAAGLTPLLAKEYAEVQAMADTLRQHPIAGPLFTPDTGQAELSGFWQDGPTGIRRRFRPDWIKHATGGRRILADYKTTTDASLTAIEKAVNEHDYHCQAAWYIDGAIATDLGDTETVMVFVFQEKTPPYLVTVTELDRETLRRGRERNRRAIDIYAECTTTGHWPGHSSEVEITSLPIWAQIRHDEEYA